MKKLLPALGVVLALLAGATVVALYVTLRDIPPPDTSDLAVKRLKVPEKENAFTYFNEATNSLYWPEQTSLVTDFLDGKQYDDKVITEIIAKNADSLKLIEQGLACRTCQMPEITSYKTPMPYIAKERSIGTIMALKSMHERLNGDYSKAVDSCISLLRFGNVLQKSGECFIECLVGVAVLDMGLKQARELSCSSKTPETELKRLTKALAELGPFDEGLVRSCKAEYKIAENLIDELSGGKLSINDLVGLGGDTKKSFLGKRRIPDYFFQPGKTKQAIADSYRNMIRNVPLNYAAIRIVDKEGLLLMDGNAIMNIIRPNCVGKILLAMLLPAKESILEKKCRLACTSSSTRIITACNMCERRNKTLPDSLEALVPEFLDAVPADPFDSKPLRYSKSKGIVYSVGEDLQDSGGSIELRPGDNPNSNALLLWRTKDAVFPIKQQSDAKQSQH